MNVVILENAFVNDVFELTNEESSSFTGMENLVFVELLYGRNFPILAPDTRPGDYGLGLDYSNVHGDSHMSDVVICATSLAHAEYKWAFVRFEIHAFEMGCFIRSIGVKPSPRGFIVTNQSGLLCDVDT